MIEREVLTIDGQPYILIDLVADTGDKALKVEWIFRDVVVRHKPLKHAEGRQLGIGNMIMAHQIEPDLARAAVIEERLISGNLRAIGVLHAIAGFRSGAGI